MDRKIYIILFLIIFSGVFIGLFIAGRTKKEPNLFLANVKYNQVNFEGKTRIIFSGLVFNTGEATANQVTINIRWGELDGVSHSGSVIIDEVSKQTSRSFEIIFELDYLATVQFYTQWIEYS